MTWPSWPCFVGSVYIMSVFNYVFITGSVPGFLHILVLLLSGLCMRK